MLTHPLLTLPLRGRGNLDATAPEGESAEIRGVTSDDRLRCFMHEGLGADHSGTPGPPAGWLRVSASRLHPPKRRANLVRVVTDVVGLRESLGFSLAHDDPGSDRATLRCAAAGGHPDGGPPGLGRRFRRDLRHQRWDPLGAAV